MNTAEEKATPPLDEFLVKYRQDDNEWWRLQSGDHQNLFEEAVDRLALALAVVEAAEAFRKTILGPSLGIEITPRDDLFAALDAWKAAQ